MHGVGRDVHEVAGPDRALLVGDDHDAAARHHEVELVRGVLVRVDEAVSVPAESLPVLKSLFNLAKSQASQPPRCCRTHTDKVAFFRCHDTGRPLCEKCAEEKKFGGQTLRVCQHCGGTAEDLVPA